MRKLAFMLLALTFVLSPMANSIAMVMGFSGEHVHFDRTWHSENVGVQLADQHGHDHEDQAPASADNDAGPTGPIKHSHAEAHTAVFVVVSDMQIILPDFATATALPPPTFPAHEHPRPPFRPPQAA